MHFRRRQRKPREETWWQPRLHLTLVLIALAIAYLVAFVIENNHQTTVHFVLGTTAVSLIWLILLSLAIGLGGGVLISQLYGRRHRGKERSEPPDAVPDLVQADEAVSEPGGAEPTA
jgi:uncharacterized integral membrane protein